MVGKVSISIFGAVIDCEDGDVFILVSYVYV